MKTLKANHKDLLAKAGKIAETAQKAGRDMNTAEATEFDGLLAKAQRIAEALNIAEGEGVEESPEIKTFSDRLDNLELQFNTPIVTGGAAATKAMKWEDEQGRVFKCAAGPQRLSDLYKPGEYPLGHYIKGMLSGNFTEEQKAQTTAIDPSGGYVLGSQLSSYVIDKARDASVMSQAGAVTFTLEAGMANLNYLRNTSDPVGGWVPEGGEIPLTNMAVGLLSITPKKFAMRITLTHETFSAINAAQLIEETCRKVMAAEIDRAMLAGSGAGQEPTGLLNTADTATETSVGSPTYCDFLSAVSKVKSNNFDPTAAIFSPNTEKSLSILKAATDGQYLAPPLAYQNLKKLITKKATDAAAVVGDFSQVGSVFGGGSEALRVQYLMSSDDIKNDSVTLRVIVSMDVVCFNPGAFCILSGIS